MAKQFSMFSIFHDCPSTNEQEQSENYCSNIPFSEEEDSAIKLKNDIHYSFNKANTPKSDPLDFFFPCSTNDTSEFCSDTLSNQYQNKNNDFCEESKYDKKNVLKRSLESHSHSYEVEEKDFSIIASSFHNFDVVKCREQIDYITNCCISDILKEINKIKIISQNSGVHTERFGERIANLYLQQDEFEKLISSVKTQFTISKGQTTQFSVDIITKSLQKEFALFKKFFPAYGFRQKVLNEVEKNQITIINADFTYGFNVVLPVILSNVYKNHTLIACETNETLSYVLQEKINLIFSCSDQNPHETQLHVLSENQLLERFSYTTLFSESNSCIIFNVSLKRSVIADIVLSNLRDLLITQKNSKLILILSPHDNVSKFEDYFSSKIPVSLLKFPNLSLPVKTVWKNAILSPCDDFTDDVVKTIISIHVVCESGDIIVFLPSLQDIQFISEKLNVEKHRYQCNRLKVVCINDGNLKPFVELANNCRNVFLLMNHYEGLVIPSACFIIDSGVQKESVFDSQKDTNVAVPTFISQARAKMRKYLVGINNVGTCFKLYNKTNYIKNMPKKEYPEVLCISPLHSLVKIFQHCPQKMKSIQFVESLPDDVLNNNIKLLKSYGAVDKDSCLTSLGEKIAKLPLPMKYSRLILLGIQHGFAYESVILVAFFIIKTGIFVESTDDEHQKLIDVIKLEFNQLDSDTVTFLNIYKQWKENGFRKLWCTKHFIDYTTLKNIRYKVTELIHLVQQYLNEEIIQEYVESSDQNYLVEMLFECFHDNLCVYTGHHRIGYRILSSRQFALIHPKSYLSQKDNFADFIIYEDLSSSNPAYLTNITSIPFELIMGYLQKNIFNFNSSDLFDDKLVKRDFDGVGEKIINQILLQNDGKKAREIEESIKHGTGSKVVLIEPDLNKGSISMYAFPDDINNCMISLKNILDSYIQTITNHEETKGVVFTKGQNNVFIEIKWTKGAETISAEHVLINVYHDLKKNASCSVEKISENTQSSSINYSLKVIWPRRFCTGEGFVNFKNQNDFNSARKLALSYIKVGDFEVFVQVSNIKGNQLLLSEIPQEVSENDLVYCFSTLLPGCEFEIELPIMAPFETRSSELLQIKKHIEENCFNYTNINKFEVEVVNPEPSSKYMIAYVNVFEKRCLNNEAKNLSATKVNNMNISCKPLYFSDLECSIEIYNALKYRINQELDIFSEKIGTQEKIYSFKVLLLKDIVNIKLSSNDIEIMKSLQILINQLLDGIRLDNRNLKDIHKLFCHGGHVFLKTLEETEKVYIMENYETKTIRLFGLQENCNYVRQYICDFLSDTENEMVKNIILSRENQNRIILKTVITQYGANLEKFIELCGLRSAALNIKSSCLSVYGKKENVEKAEECIKELSASTGLSDVCTNLSPEEICPVCFCPAESLTFRLQHCGHLYCSSCIKILIAQAQFPLQCCVEDCSKTIILEDIKYVLDEDIVKINELADKSLKAYLEKKRDNIFYCPAADCSMFVYKNKITENKWNCPLCKNFICISCNVVYHEGFTCDIYRGSKEDPDYSFKVWQKANTQCKRCPKCDTAIEKRDGCNHMTCGNSFCGAHFCWICRQIYSTGNEVYNHISREHPGQLFLR